MHYRMLGNTGIKTSILGFGCMRLPTVAWDKARIAEKEAIKIIRKGIDSGITYVDTAEPYHMGESEIVVGKALKNGYRDRVTLATKSPVWKDDFNKPEHFEDYLNLQLKKLDVDHIDIYLLHSLDRTSWKEKVLGFDLIERAEKARDEGKIRYLGFSFHDSPDVLKEIIDSNAFRVMLVQYNILNPANEEMVSYAAEKGLGVAIMGPVAGGRLAGEPPVEMHQWLNRGRRNFVDMALKYVWTNPSVSVALSGMGSEQMVDDNLLIASDDTYTLSEEEMETAQDIRRKFKELTDNICTACEYCMPCPNEVNIPFIFTALTYYQVYNQKERARLYYKNIGNVEEYYPPGKDATACVECGECEKKCPQKIPIAEQLKKAHQILSTGV
ncbi:MAG: aldo/keto reductase [Theionarchaea archaeon]|nr:aldo/keto reductase [Theionarchaea archaeon]MBU7000728.1 aldo/keto reductase [Theionarchaea archaeon]MBU7021489.1 aldo/keto reductase [Theionarchaea archaeon]MBU7033570.1 aldo/keto reductase [Theionarchaea archaeon]MBU7039620.1 aldo/keto reductase [Theionarchaea archaeon]